MQSPSLSITGTTRLLGIIGDPVKHSLSPLMHNAALGVMGLDWVYVPFPVQQEHLAAALSGFAAIGVQGFNITIPHKQAILPLLDKVTPLAKAIGAVNTVWPFYNEALSVQGWQGTNTDVQGFISPLQAIPPAQTQGTALILGGGGAARAVVAGCHQLNWQSIWVVGRNLEKLQAFQRSWQETEIAAKLKIAPWSDLPQLLPQSSLVVNTTPLGMAPQGSQSPLSEEALALLPAETIVYDLIYTPSPTQLLKLAEHRGLKTIDGVEMLVQQGAAALEIWTGQSVPVEVMRSTLSQALFP
ncbi:MAG: shikimate dehydrogenase [Prochlorotrichaceae cyanobacterium]|jgi:shikimate dehydrogenase